MTDILGLDWDEQTVDHIARHAVEIHEVYEAVEEQLYARRSWGYLLVLGATYGGRYLAVILDDLGEGIWRIVTARPVTDAERRMAQRGRR